MARELMFPQFGMVTFINLEAREAKVFIPIYGFETKAIQISRSIPIKDEIAPIVTQDTQAPCKYTDGLKNGSQVVVTFIGGNLQNAVITALI